MQCFDRRTVWKTLRASCMKPFDRFLLRRSCSSQVLLCRTTWKVRGASLAATSQLLNSSSVVRVAVFNALFDAWKMQVKLTGNSDIFADIIFLGSRSYERIWPERCWSRGQDQRVARAARIVNASTSEARCSYVFADEEWTNLASRNEYSSNSFLQEYSDQGIASPWLIWLTCWCFM